jgi:hypothetical protein
MDYKYIIDRYPQRSNYLIDKYLCGNYDKPLYIDRHEEDRIDALYFTRAIEIIRNLTDVKEELLKAVEKYKSKSDAARLKYVNDSALYRGREDYMKIQLDQLRSELEFQKKINQ